MGLVHLFLQNHCEWGLSTSSFREITVNGACPPLPFGETTVHHLFLSQRNYCPPPLGCQSQKSLSMGVSHRNHCQWGSVTEITVNGCQSQKSLSMGSVTEITVNGCQSQKSLSMGSVTEITVNGGQSQKSLSMGVSHRNHCQWGSVTEIIVSGVSHRNHCQWGPPTSTTRPM